MKKSFTIKKKRQGKAFNPNHEQVDQAVTDFLRQGGRITKLEPTPTPKGLEPMADNLDNADNYLLGV